MRVNTNRTDGVSASTMAALMLAVFTVSVGFGVVLPLLPYLIERLLGAGIEVAQVSRHTGLLTAVYTLSLFLFAPMWGRLSDRRGARGVLLVGLLGFGATMLAFSFVESLAAVYAERFLSGLFAGSAQGWQLGKQTAAASLGVTLGSAAGGLLFNVTALPGASFVLTAGLTVLGFLLSLGLPHLLVFPSHQRVAS